jgi:hypothetical protein
VKKRWHEWVRAAPAGRATELTNESLLEFEPTPRWFPWVHRSGTAGHILLGVVGAGVGLLVVNADRHWWSHAAHQFARHPAFAIWLFALAAETGLLAIVLGLTNDRLCALHAEYKGRKEYPRKKIFANVAILTVVLTAFLWAVEKFVPEYPLPHHVLKMVGLTLLAWFVALRGFIGMWTVRFALQADYIEKASDPSTRAVQRYLRLRDHLQFFLTCSGAIIAGGVLAAGALRDAMIADNPAIKTTYPTGLLLAYGLFFTAILAVVYAPAFAAATTAGRRLLVTAAPASTRRRAAAADGGAELVEWLTGRSELRRHLRLDVDFMVTFRRGVAILAPIGGAALALLIGQ